MPCKDVFVEAVDDSTGSASLSLSGTLFNPAPNELEASYTVTNNSTTQDVQATLSIEVVNESTGEVVGTDSVSLDLVAGSSDARSFVIQTGNTTPTQYTVSATVGDATETNTIEVSAPSDGGGTVGQANITLSNYTVSSPSQNEIRASIDLTNSGQAEGTATLELAVTRSTDGSQIVDRRRSVTVAAGSSKTVSFEVALSNTSVQQYQVCVNRV